MALITSAWAVVGVWTIDGAVAERNHADLDAGGLADDECVGGRLGRRQPRRLDVGGRHAVGHVYGQHDRRLPAGRLDGGDGPGQPDDEHGERHQE